VRLSQHFTLAEAERSMLATRLGIDNSVPRELHSRLEHVAEMVLEPIRRYFNRPFSPSSWYRCLALNRALRSRDMSAHVQALAVDVEVPGVANDALFDWCAENLHYDQLIREFPKEGVPASGWVHIGSAAPGERPRMQRFSIPPHVRYAP